MQLEYWMRIAAYCLLAINILTWILFVCDKIKAVTGRWRIPEKVLLFFAFIGGSLGALLAMLMARHKLRNKRFSVGVPIFFILHLALIITMWLKFS